MNQRPPVLSVSKAIPGFLQFKAAEGMSPRTIESYGRDLRMWLEYHEDVDIYQITILDLHHYIFYMLKECQTRHFRGEMISLYSQRPYKNRVS